jgi:hypothetical protein
MKFVTKHRLYKTITTSISKMEEEEIDKKFIPVSKYKVIFTRYDDFDGKNKTIKNWKKNRKTKWR